MAKDLAIILALPLGGGCHCFIRSRDERASRRRLPEDFPREDDRLGADRRELLKMLDGLVPQGHSGSSPNSPRLCHGTNSAARIAQSTELQRETELGRVATTAL